MSEADFTEFVSLTKRAVFGAVRANLRPDLRHSIDDVVQETYLRIYRYLQGRGPAPRGERVSAWAYVIARNEARRWNGRNRPTSPEALFESPDPRSQSHAMGLEDESELMDLLAQIPEPFRAPLELLSRDLTTGEIAMLLSIPAGTAKSRISRGRAMLRKLVPGREPLADTT